MVKTFLAVVCALAVAVSAVPMYGTYTDDYDMEAEVEYAADAEPDTTEEYETDGEAKAEYDATMEAEYESAEELQSYMYAYQLSIDVRAILGQSGYFEYFSNWRHFFGERIGGRYGGRIEHAYYFENGVSVSVQAVDISGLGLDIVSVNVGCVTGIFINFGLAEDYNIFNFAGINDSSTYADVAALFDVLPYCTVASAFDERIGAAKSYGFWAFDDPECTRFVRFYFDSYGYVMAISYFVK